MKKLLLLLLIPLVSLGQDYIPQSQRHKNKEHHTNSSEKENKKNDYHISPSGKKYEVTQYNEEDFIDYEKIAHEKWLEEVRKSQAETERIRKWNEEDRKNNFTVGGIDMRYLPSNNLEGLITFFLLDAAEKLINMDITNINQTIDVEFSDLDGNVGEAYMKCPNKMKPLNELIFNRNIKIKIDRSAWNKAPLSKKYYILYHELGHDVFNLAHGEGGPMMDPTEKEKVSWNDFFNYRNRLFDYVQEKYKSNPKNKPNKRVEYSEIELELINQVDKNGIRFTEEHYNNGQLQYLESRSYRNSGALHGPQLSYYRNGQLKSKEYYNAGKKHGWFIDYEEDGTIIRESLHIDGKQEGWSRGYDGGKLILESEYKNGKKHGWSKFYTNGILDTKSYYENGVKKY